MCLMEDESITQDRIVSTATHWRCLICNRRKSSPDSGWALCILSSMHFGAGEQLTLLCWVCPTPLFCEGTNDTAARMLPCHPQAWSPMCIDLELCLMKLPQYLHACLVNWATASSHSRTLGPGAPCWDANNKLSLWQNRILSVNLHQYL